jgi:acetyl-CoA carboxylase biotin carboxyl carrier protein
MDLPEYVMKKTARKNETDPDSPASTDQLNLAEIRELIELVSDKQFSEFELERGNFRLRLQKGSVHTVVEVARPQSREPLDVRPAPAPVAAPAPQPAAPLAPPEESLHLVTSPIVGTFYRASSPTGDPFVKLGDSVETGRTLCIIEAMKLMNEIPADAGGVVAKIFVENGQPVEYGQLLFGLRP